MGDPLDPPPGNFYVPLVDGASNSAMPPSNENDFSARQVTLYSLLGLFFVTAIATGATIYDNHTVPACLSLLIGTVGLCATVVLLIRYHPKTTHALIVTAVALLATWAFIAYVISTKPKEIAEGIEKATAPMNVELKNEKQRATNAEMEMGQLQTQLEIAEQRLAKATSQFGPQSPILRLNDARRYQIIKSMVTGMPTVTRQGCDVGQAFEMSTQQEYPKNANVWGEVQEPLYFAGWRFHQIPKAVFSPGISITVGVEVVMPTSARLA
jgi:hypothetical protein